MIAVENMYGGAQEMLAAGEYSAAQAKFSNIGWYRDSAEQAAECLRAMGLNAVSG